MCGRQQVAIVTDGGLWLVGECCAVRALAQQYRPCLCCPFLLPAENSSDGTPVTAPMHCSTQLQFLSIASCCTLCRCILIDNIAAYHYLDKVGRGPGGGANPALGMYDITRWVYLLFRLMGGAVDREAGTTSCASLLQTSCPRLVMSHTAGCLQCSHQVPHSAATMRLCALPAVARREGAPLTLHRVQSAVAQELRSVAREHRVVVVATKHLLFAGGWARAAGAGWGSAMADGRV